MKKIFAILAVVALCAPAFAQEENKESEKKDSGYVFTDIKVLPITSVKDQNRAGTCWCYSGLSFIESELLRMGKGEYDLSEMYVVHHTYQDRAMKSFRTDGETSFSQGGAFSDVIWTMKYHGLVPEQEMRPGVMYGDTLSNHGELSTLTNAMVKAVAKDVKNAQIGSDSVMLWTKAVKAVHDVYLGKCPETFTYEGKQYTPQSFYEMLGLNADDYVSITSFTHHPFYSQFVIEVSDNWRWSLSYNVTIDELTEIMDYAIDNGYTIAWGSDVSEDGFRKGVRKGYCVLPDLEATREQGSDMAHWTGLTKEERAKEAYEHPTPQRWVSQYERQLGYDQKTTTDDHGMHIYGKAVDQMGNEYYKVKNSWGDVYEYHGSFYVSKAFVRYKTMNYVVHKDAIPSHIKAKLGIEDKTAQPAKKNKKGRK
ncbi:MAG: aminopeptidase [Bacteroidales bacterium]|nr:aminopeptidase [Candidatus Colimorpha onthohippi]